MFQWYQFKSTHCFSFGFLFNYNTNPNIKCLLPTSNRKISAHVTCLSLFEFRLPYDLGPSRSDDPHPGALGFWSKQLGFRRGELRKKNLPNNWTLQASRHMNLRKLSSCRMDGCYSFMENFQLTWPTLTRKTPQFRCLLCLLLPTQVWGKSFFSGPWPDGPKHFVGTCTKSKAFQVAEVVPRKAPPSGEAAQIEHVAGACFSF